MGHAHKDHRDRADTTRGTREQRPHARRCRPRQTAWPSAGQDGTDRSGRFLAASACGQHCRAHARRCWHLAADQERATPGRLQDRQARGAGQPQEAQGDGEVPVRQRRRLESGEVPARDAGIARADVGACRRGRFCPVRDRRGQPRQVRPGHQPRRGADGSGNAVAQWPSQRRRSPRHRQQLGRPR